METSITERYENLNKDLSPQSNISPLRKWSTLVVLSLALAIIIIDTTILNVSLRTIINDLHTDITSMQWVITAYSLMLAAFTITGGRLGDLFGRKNMFILGAIIFAAGSFITSISGHVGTMIWGESIIEGIGAALMMPATSALLVTTFKGRERAVAFGVWGGIAAASSAIGPILGGWLTTNYSWRWAFRINLVVALILVLSSFVIQEARDQEEKPTLDILGVLLTATGLLSIVFGFIQSSTYGWWKAKDAFIVFGHTVNLGGYSPVPGFILLGIIILGLFVGWEQFVESRNQTPLVSLAIFRNRQFVSGVLVSSVLSLGMAGLIFSVPVFLQAVRNLDAFHTGLAMLPLSIAILIAAPMSAFLSKFILPKYIVQAGLLLNVGAFLALRYVMSPTTTASDMILGFLLFGGGMGLIMGQINNIAMSAVSPQQAGEASGLMNTMRQIGSTLGSAILGAVLISALGTNLVNGVNNSQVIPQSMKPTIAEKISQQSSSVEFGGVTTLDNNIPENIQTEITTISHQATADADRTTLLYGALFSLLGFLLSFLLPSQKHLDREHSATAHPEPIATTTEAEFVTTEPRHHRERRGGGVSLAAVILAALIVGLGTGIGGYFIGRNYQTKSDKDDSTISAMPQALDSTFGNLPSAADITSDSGSAATGNASVTPSTQPAPATPTGYTNPGWHFGFNSQQVSVQQTSPSELTFTNANTGATYGSVQENITPSVHSFEELQQQVVSDPNATNIQNTSIGGSPAIRYWSQNGSVETVVTLHNGTLFYITGPLSENITFRFI